MNYLIFNKTYNYDNILEYINKNFYKFTYINNYNKLLGKTKLNNDIGWSCTIKSIQMMFAKILNIFNKNDKTKIVNDIYKENGLLSIQNFIEKLNNRNIDEGQYLGSYLISNIYSQIINKNQNKFDFEINVTIDNLIDINKLNFYKKNILLFSTKLGLDYLNKEYKPLIKNCFLSQYFLGFIGGVGKSCYYFFGLETNTENLLYLDPHIVNNYNKNIKDNSELLTKDYSLVHIDHLNPSITFCFYYNNYDSFMKLKKFLESNTIFNILNKNDYNKFYNTIKKTDNSWEII